MDATRVATIDRVESTPTPGISHVRLSDGTGIRMQTQLVELLQSTAGRITSGQVAYSVDAAGNRHSPRVATDDDRQSAVLAPIGSGPAAGSRR